MPAAKTKDQRAVIEALNQTMAAEVLGIARETLNRSDAPRNKDGSYNTAKIVAWHVARKLAAASPDPLLVGGSDSPNLERYRAAKAKLAEMDAAEREGQLCDVDALCNWFLLEVAPAIRNCIADLQRQFGEAALKPLCDAIDNGCQKAEAKRPEQINASPGSS